MSGATVYYHYDNIPIGEEGTQIETAISTWNSALALTCSDVVFVQGSVVGAAPSMTIRNGILPASAAGRTTYDLVYGGETQIVTITINPNVTDANTNIPFFDPSEPGFSTAYTKVALHELGHALGIHHYLTGHPDICRDQTPQTTDDQIAGLSVMNNGCMQNDQENNQSTNITACDFNQLNTAYSCPTPTPTPTPGPVAGYCNGSPDYGQFPPSGCATGFVNVAGTCTRSTQFQNRCAEPDLYDAKPMSPTASLSPFSISVGGLFLHQAQGPVGWHERAGLRAYVHL